MLTSEGGGGGGGTRSGSVAVGKRAERPSATVSPCFPLRCSRAAKCGSDVSVGWQNGHQECEAKVIEPHRALLARAKVAGQSIATGTGTSAMMQEDEWLKAAGSWSRLALPPPPSGRKHDGWPMVRHGRVR